MTFAMPPDGRPREPTGEGAPPGATCGDCARFDAWDDESAHGACVTSRLHRRACPGCGRVGWETTYEIEWHERNESAEDCGSFEFDYGKEREWDC